MKGRGIHKSSPPTPAKYPSLKKGLTIKHMIRARNIEDGAITAAKLNLTPTTVTVAAGDLAGTESVTGTAVLGYAPVLQDAMVESITISADVLTVTLASSATTDNSFVVQTI